MNEDSCEWFRCEETLRVNESLRPVPVEEKEIAEQQEDMDTKSDEPEPGESSSKLEELD